MVNKMHSYTIIFDLGNVILYVDQYLICHKLAQTYHCNEEYVLKKIFQSGLERQFDEGKLSPILFTEMCSKALGIKLNLKEFKKIWSSNILFENIPVIELIKNLKKKYKIFVLSNTNKWHIEYVRYNFNILDLFDELILSYKVGYTKPDKRIFEHAIKLSNSSNILYIDDIKEYVEAAKKVGLKAIQYINFKKLCKDLKILGII